MEKTKHYHVKYFKNEVIITVCWSSRQISSDINNIYDDFNNVLKLYIGKQIKKNSPTLYY